MLKKILDGKEVPCSPTEEAQILAEWAANDPAKRPAAPKIIDAATLTKLLIAKGAISQQDVNSVLPTES